METDLIFPPSLEQIARAERLHRQRFHPPVRMKTYKENPMDYFIELEERLKNTNEPYYPGFLIDLLA